MSADLPNSTATREQQQEFLDAAHRGPLTWEGMCQSLARKAARLPAVAPSALAAATMTPADRRVHAVKDLRQGMVVYFDDPNDSNPFAHVTTVHGWEGGTPSSDLADLIVWSNDAARTGGVDLVRGSFFPAHWGDGFLFGADCLNGYDLPGYDHGTPPPSHQTIGGSLDVAIAAVRKALQRQRAKGHTERARALARDLAELKETRVKYPRR